MEGEAAEAEEAGFPVAGEAVDAGGLGGGQRDRRDAGRAGLAAAGGQRRGAGIEQQVSGAGGGLVRGLRGVLAGGCGGGEGDGAGEGGLDGGGPELGEGGQGGVPADRVPGAGLALVPAEGVLSRFESGFDWPAAARDGDEVRHGRWPVFRCPAEVEGVLVLCPVQAADQQELPQVRGGDRKSTRLNSSD